MAVGLEGGWIPAPRRSRLNQTADRLKPLSSDIVRSVENDTRHRRERNDADDCDELERGLDGLGGH
jgi:hypothetical protein